MLLRTISLALAVSALLAGCSNGSFDSGSTHIADDGIVVRGDQVILHGNGDIEGTLDAAGNLTIDGRTITVDATQRTQLQQYYQGAHAVRQHGIATGKAGAAVAAQSVRSAATHIVGGDSEQADAALDAATTRIDGEASKICLDMRQIKAAQDRLATGLVAFKPFARIVDDAGDCSSRSLEWHDTDRSLALKSGDGKGVQVVRAKPSGVWGLQQDDVILAVDGQPVNDVDELLQRLSASKPSEAKVRLRRGNAEQEVAIAESDYSNILDQPPAATPAK